MACETNITDVPISPSLPAVTDTVMFTLADGTTVRRTWLALLNSLATSDIEFQVGVTAGAPSEGTFIYTNAALIGRRIRLYREGVKISPLGDSTVSKYSFDNATGTITVNDAWSDQERISIEPY